MRPSSLTLALLGLAVSGARSEPEASPHADNSVGIRSRRIAVIGAGAGGSSAAYHLKKFANQSGLPINITIFEQSDHIGGRSTTVNIWDEPGEAVELGASIFVKVNKVLVEAVETFNLTTTEYESTSVEDNGPSLGIWNGKTFVFQQTESSYYWWDVAKLIWRYGWSPVKTNNLMKATVGKFLKMYDEPYFPWASLSEVAYSLGLTAVTSATGEQYLKENGVSAAFANEIVQASTRVNYAQNLPLIHGLETMVCMAASGAMAVVGGNWQIFDRMARNATNDVRLATKISAVQRKDDGSYSIGYSEGESEDTVLTEEEFDTVILAAPYQFAKLKISPEPKSVPNEIPYVKLHVTLFTSPHKLSPSAFQLSADSPVPRTILTTLAPNEHLGNSPDGVGSAGFFSISTLREVYNRKLERREYLYKIFSPTEVSASYLATLLDAQHDGSNDKLAEEDVSWIYRKLFHSYPYEYPRVTFEELKLDEDLWYTSGIESFISTMETSGLMGKNIASLIVNEMLHAKPSSLENAFERVEDHARQKPIYGEM